MVQTKHHESLYIDHLPFAIKEKYKDTAGLSAGEAELLNSSLTWELGEIDMVGYVGLFHLWEKYSKDFLSRIFNNKCSEWPKLPGWRTYPNKVFAHLEGKGIILSTFIVSELEEANSVVNAYKHGEEAMEKLMCNYPQYFCVKGEAESFYIPDGVLKKLFETVQGFWEEIEKQVEPCFE